MAGGAGVRRRSKRAAYQLEALSHCDHYFVYHPEGREIIGQSRESAEHCGGNTANLR